MSFLPHLRKIRKLKRTKPSTIEDEVAKALYDLEMNHKTLRTSLPRFHINTAKEIEYGAGEKRGLIVFYPLRFLMLVRKIQKVLVAELEKKFAGRVVVLVAQRKIVRRPKDVYSLQAVQRSRTQTAVNENILTDLLYPCDIVGRRWKCRVDGSKLMKVYLDSRDRKKCEGRLRIVADIFKRLTHRPVSFGFMWNPKLQQVAH